MILSGDIDAKAGFALARKHFGAWVAAPTRTPPVVSAATTAAATATQPTTALIDMGPSGQAAVVVALALPAQSSGDRVVGAVVNAALGGNYSSRLNEEIRVKRGLSYGAFSSLEARGDGALFRAAVQTKNESAGEVVGLTQSEMDRFAAEPLGGDELAARKAALIGGFSRSGETTSGLAQRDRRARHHASLAGRAEDADRTARGGERRRRAALRDHLPRRTAAPRRGWPVTHRPSPLRCRPSARAP